MPPLLDSLRQILLLQPDLEAELAASTADERSLFSSMLYVLTHVSLEEAVARRRWHQLVAHREVLRRQLGRDTGLRVALLDLLLNVTRDMQNPVVLELAAYEGLRRAAETDPLTGLANQGAFSRSFEREFQRAQRHGRPLSLVLLDLDDFKAVNDEHGHDVGDAVLQQAAEVISGGVRDIDLAARCGGEEFALLLPDTPAAGARVVAERVRNAVAERFAVDPSVVVTVSAGVGTFPDAAGSAIELRKRVDLALYQAKSEGKNCVRMAAGDPAKRDQTETHARQNVSRPTPWHLDAGAGSLDPDESPSPISINELARASRVQGTAGAPVA